MESSQLSRVNINLLVTLQVLLKERNASAAANQLNLSQSSVSKNLAQLRHLFNDPLFHRSARGLIPTAYALALEPKLTSALAAMQQLFSPDEFDLSSYQGCIRLSMQESAFEFIAGAFISKVLSKAPGMKLNTWFKDNISLEQLNQGQLDFVILPHDIGQTPNLGNLLNIRELYRDDLVCLVQENHPALSKPWDQDAYLSCRHIHVRDNELGQPIFDKNLAKQGLQRDIAINVPDFNTAGSLCSRSDLVFTTSSTWARFALSHKPLRQLPMPCPSLPVVYSLIWHQRSDLDPAHLWLKNQIIQAADSINNQNKSA
ncbi:LysR family transcriptional regulator [Thalassomonas viridans]|uniref:LysR family transcriptional regulator n=1 Tax=Thalassomonas viridans TaxID=137584 RepID=A0AAE9Z338_9GAMM|nr:LysR family transcriptional regulator [Thalassomonas viridans]WDE05164.1 LysR family transcriptional regulator [Thalassomonas viridans]